jgi:tetratricopeptide (TPR) repeat protein
MLQALGHAANTFCQRVLESLDGKDYDAALRDLRHMIRLDGGDDNLSRLADELISPRTQRSRSQPEAVSIEALLKDESGRTVIAFIVDRLSFAEQDWRTWRWLERLKQVSPELRDRLLKRILQLEQGNVDALRRYAVSLESDGDIDDAEAFCKQAMEADPMNASNLCDCGQLLAGLGRLPEGERALLSAFLHLDNPKSDDTAEVCFSLWLVSRLQGHDAERWERCFKFLIQQGFKRYPWSFDLMLKQAEKELSSEEFEYAKAMASAFLDESKVVELERYERWRNLEPLNPKPQTALATS